MNRYPPSYTGVERSKYTWELHARMLNCRLFHKLVDEQTGATSPGGFEAISEAEGPAILPESPSLPEPCKPLETELIPPRTGDWRRALVAL
jgi:hypothetical protein